MTKPLMAPPGLCTAGNAAWLNEGLKNGVEIADEVLGAGGANLVTLGRLVEQDILRICALREIAVRFGIYEGGKVGPEFDRFTVLMWLEMGGRDWLKAESAARQHSGNVVAFPGSEQED